MTTTGCLRCYGGNAAVYTNRNAGVIHTRCRDCGRWETTRYRDGARLQESKAYGRAAR